MQTTTSAIAAAGKQTCPQTCPLCRDAAAAPLATVMNRWYLHCAHCGLAFMSPADRLSTEEEQSHYRHHRNTPTDPGYRRFLSKVTVPLIPLLRPRACGLDYGCGPGPTLSVMLREAGFKVSDYDPCFAPHQSLLSRTYDFITCTEAAEHFHEPAEEFGRLDRLLRPGGCLAVMTETYSNPDTFADWWYVRDPTHVCFYAAETMTWIANQRSWRAIPHTQNVTFFIKPALFYD